MEQLGQAIRIIYDQLKVVPKIKYSDQDSLDVSLTHASTQKLKNFKLDSR